MSNKDKSAVIVIPHYNDTARLTTCLTALMANPAEALAKVDLVVCDNTSTEDITPVKAAFPSVRFLTQPIKGAAAARNMAVEQSTAPLIFFTDADCVPSPTWIETAFAVASQADLVGGRVDTFDETPAPKSGSEAFETVFAFDQRSYVENKSFSVTANLVTSRVIFEKVGDFIVGRSEDVDWCHRARDMGYSIAYADALAVKHPTRQTWDDLVRKWRRMAAEGFETTQGSVPKRIAQAAVIGASGFAHVPKILTSSKGLSGLEKWRAIVTLIRLRALRMAWLLRLTFGGKIT